jgi:hypothetical protein
MFWGRLVRIKKSNLLHFRMSANKSCRHSGGT